ncbi:histidine kinase CKI1-like [Punica granatum]|uniref:histidine kinase n=1 Tax=Punica granatum TaxID=22663 RepID=A0A6P8E5I7_PUNGR|nr:histidine kinase CKI1-like [Punica granatum]
MQLSSFPVLRPVWFFVFLLIVILSFICVIVRAARREMRLSARLIEQMEATRQAQNESIAFAKASHDIRASLACISAFIEMCYHEAAPMTELAKNLEQMDNCAKDLLGLLNSILDKSKIEAGKMVLEEEEFDLAQLLEDVVDMFHPVAMKKNVDVVLDLFDGSMLKHSIVKGDRGKLKRILSNLLSNAVKFTPEGHITVRAWAQEPNSEDHTIHTTNQKAQKKRLSSWFFGKGEGWCKDDEGVNRLQRKPNSMEFVFEVNDTGKGIPKEKWNSVFENYVQVQETAQGEGGTGLGLGIVQSLVRLMGGDIKIVEKEIEKTGTCFRFNMLFAVSGGILVSPHKLMNEEGAEKGSKNVFGPEADLSLPCRSSYEGLSLAILLIGGTERRRVSKSYMERLGIKVWAGREWIKLPSILRKAKRYLDLSCHSSSGESDMSQNADSLSESASNNSSSDQDQIQPFDSRFLLLVVDLSFGPIMELIRVVSEFRRGIQNTNTASCKVVWLDKPSAHYRRILEEEPDLDLSNDVIISRPFHGTRLIEVIKLLPEFKGSSAVRNRTGKMKKIAVGDDDSSSGSIREEGPDEVRLLSGKKVLVVEDVLVLQRLAKWTCLSLGASVDVCEDGDEAVSIVSSKLRELRKLADGASFSSSALPYDFILMDCEMPIVNGYDATRRIRQEELEYNVRIPIIAVSAHSEGPEVKMAFEVGMDSYIQKPLEKERLVEVLQEMNIT